ncbi:MAG TPA: hypothetical protein DCK79_07425 [Candidatus Atribacteria bacterium]|nr:hypothetical protein [Candidatus Atribacteria bacterium]
MKLSLVSKRYPNNTNLNITNLTTTKGEKDVAVAVNFKKLKEEGEEKMQAVRERMVKLDLKEEFVEQLLKEYPVEKIEEKLDLLMERKNVKSPAGWLRAALKNDYRDAEPSLSFPQSSLSFPQSSLSFPRRRESIRYDEEPAEGSGDDKCRGVLQYALPQNVIANDRRECGNPKHVNLDSLLPSPPEGNCRGRIHPTRLEPDKKILSTEDARRRFHSLREKLMAMDSP